MNLLQSLLFCAVSLAASVCGAVCGIGGGVIIKPVLDSFGWAEVSTISFLSGCTVLSMSCYSVGRSMISREKTVNLKTCTPLAIGAAIGGVVGRQIFAEIKAAFSAADTVGAVQSVCLGVITLFTLLYTVNKARIKTYNAQSMPLCMAIGLVLGTCSSFLGIGGGPINLVVLYFFFSMDTKTAAANSLYIILFSQAASLIVTILTKTVPEFTPLTLVLMVLGGILGGVLGRGFNKRLSAGAVDKLFICLMCAIVFISCCNVWRYSV